MLYIIKHKSIDLIERCFNPALTEDMEVIWSGNDFDQFYSETGFEEKDIHGLYKGTKDFHETYPIITYGTSVDPETNEDVIIPEESIGTNTITKPWIYFSQSQKDAHDRKKLPKLTGSALSEKIRSLFKQRSLKQRAGILNPVLPLLNIMEKDPEITLSEYNEFKEELMLGVNQALTLEEISQIEQVLNDWILGYNINIIN